VDLYLHPQSGTPEDLILQAAIRKKVAEAVPQGSGTVYVRVIDRIVFLSGSVKSEEMRTRARQAAESIDIRLDGTPLKPQSVHADEIAVGS
jgi:osmotically-inducible protein OsmY